MVGFRNFRPLAVGAALLMAGCAAPTETRFGTFFGIFFANESISTFRYCMHEGPARWLLIDDDGILAAHLPVVPGEPRSAYVVVNGHLSPGGYYGPNGFYIHELRVVEVLEVSRDTLRKCELPGEPS